MIWQKEMLMNFCKRILELFKKYYFILFAAIALLLPDIAIRGMVEPKAFSENYVDVVTQLFTFGWIGIIIVFCMFFLAKNKGRITYIIVNLLFLILAVSEYVYFRIFDQFFWLKSIAIAGEGSDYLGYAAKYIDKKMYAVIIFSLIFIILAAIKWKSVEGIGKKKWLIMLVPMIAVAGTHLYMQPQLHNDNMSGWDVWKKPRVVYSNFTDVNKSMEASGLYQFVCRNITTTFIPDGKQDEDKLIKADKYFADKGEMKENKHTGMFEGKNVIAVMMESIDTWMISQKYTPTLHKMMKEGINFTNYNAPFFGAGFTFNSEFAFNSGFFTPVSEVSAANFSKKSFPYSLANLFKDAGYTTNSFHFNDSEFYNRGIMHKSLGYEKYNSIAKFGVPDIESQLVSNMMKKDEVYNKMVEQQPFMNFVITYSAHLPYDKDEGKLALAKEYYPHLIDESIDPEKNNALILAADTDEFFRLLLDRLEADGLLDNTVIIAYTDHFAYGVSDQETMLSEWKKGDLSYRVPAFIYSKGMKRTEVNKPMMTVDWLPTLVNLFGLDRNGKYIGNDIFDPDNKGFAYFETHSWLDEKMYYDASKDYGDEFLEVIAYIQKQNQRVEDTIAINDIVVSGDYFGNRKE